MKRFVSIILLFAALAFCASCGASYAEKHIGNQGKSVQNVLNEARNASSAANDSENSEYSKSALSGMNGSYDVDLTMLNGNMVYAEVFNMMNSPFEYIGKTVRMKGAFSLYSSKERNYYACVIADAGACCSQGIEFVLEGEYEYPKDYPEPGSSITVSGVFDTYYEGENLYCQLINAHME